MSKQAAYLSNTIVVCLAVSFAVATRFTNAIASEPYPGPIFGSYITGALFLTALLWGGFAFAGTNSPKKFSLIGFLAVITVGHLGMYLESWMISSMWVMIGCGSAVGIHVASSVDSKSEWTRNALPTVRCPSQASWRFFIKQKHLRIKEKIQDTRFMIYDSRIETNLKITSLGI